MDDRIVRKRLDRDGRNTGQTGRPKRCPLLRQSFHEWASHSIGYSVRARAYYQQQRGKGVDHQGAVRGLAFKWIRIIFRCWEERDAYDESKYLAVLTKRGSSLLALVTTAKSL